MSSVVCITQVFQRRLDGSVDFYRDWNEYKDGFGFLRREFWLGKDKISYLTNQKDYELRIDLNSVHYISSFAKYNLFRISDEASKYKLVGLVDYDWNSTARKAFLYFCLSLHFQCSLCVKLKRS